MSYIIATDSTTDLPFDLVEKNENLVLPLTFILNGEEYHNYLDERELKTKDFYNALRKGAISKTAQITANDARMAFKPLLDKGLDILMIAFSSGLSGTYKAIKLAADELMEEYKERKIYVVDSLAASMGEGLLVYYANQYKKEGLTLEENARKIEELKFRLCHWFTVDDIDTLKRGGRVSASAAFLAKNLRIKPVLHVDNAGHLIPVSKKIGRKSSLNCLVEAAKKLFDRSYEQTIMIGHGDCLEEALEVGTSLQEHLPIKEIIYNNIGPVIGAHSGPGTIAIFFVGEKR